MPISVFGAGYVGLVTAVCLSAIGHDVVCVDTDQKKIDLLMQGVAPIYEQGLQALLTAQRARRTLHFSTDPHMALAHGHILIVAVGTPLASNHNVDLHYVYTVVEMIAKHIDHDALIVLKSTVPPGTAEQLTHYVTQQTKGLELDVASNPEFLQEGIAIQQCMHPDRIIIGAEKMSTIQLLYDMYQPIIQNKHPCLIMDKTSAELTKYAANAFLAAKISFINEISHIAEQVGGNIESVKTGLGLDHRINPRFFTQGCGFGGSCFPKDIMTLIATAKTHGITPHVLQAIMERNTLQQRILFDKVSDFFQHNLTDKTIALWGLTFKPHTDDIRHATSHVVAHLLWEAGAHIRAYDPMGMDHFAEQYPGHPQLTLSESAMTCLQGADVLLITTEWPEFKVVPLSTIKKSLRHAAIFDGRNIINANAAAQHAIYYQGIGSSLSSVRNAYQLVE